MRMSIPVARILVAAAALAAAVPLGAQWAIDLESGLVWSGYNDVRIPGDTGTLFSLSRDLKVDSAAYLRARLTWQIGARHALSVLYAPLALDASGPAPVDLAFNGQVFAAGTPLTGRYMFNSYRLTYRYTLVEKPRFKLGIGFTAKIRDAAIKVEGGGASTENTNVGFVPLLNFRLEWTAAERLKLLLEGDALAAPQGRAEDVFLGLIWNASRSVAVKAGYRFVEGGAENAKVYNFTWINYASLGLVWSF